MKSFISALHFPAISFMSPENLWLLLIVPFAVAFYLLMLRRRKKSAVRYGNFGMLKQAIGPGSRIRRHLPPALFLLAVTLTIIGIARPTAVVSIASHKSTVIMAMDVSISMRASDIKPTRIEAMQAAGKEFIAQQPRGVNIGIVAFAGGAFLVQPPTADHSALDQAIDRFELQRRTAVGSAIFAALQALFPGEQFQVNPFTANGDYLDPAFNQFANRGRRLGAPAAGKKPPPVEPGSNKSAVIILLTDGATNTGPDPVEAAREAANHGVRVYTVGFGTPDGGVIGFGRYQMRAQLDEEALKHIADVTRAHYYRAGSQKDLEAVYKLLSKSVVVEIQETEVTSFFTAAAAVLALVSAGLSLLWFSRIF